MYDFIYRDDYLQGCGGDGRKKTRKERKKRKKKSLFGCPPIPRYSFATDSLSGLLSTIISLLEESIVYRNRNDTTTTTIY